MIQKLKDMGINAEAQNGNLHNTAEEEMAKILAPLKTSLNVVMAQGFSQTTRLIPTQDQPDPEMSSHRRTNVSNNTSQSMYFIHQSIQDLSLMQIQTLVSWLDFNGRSSTL